MCAVVLFMLSSSLYGTEQIFGFTVVFFANAVVFMFCRCVFLFFLVSRLWGSRLDVHVAVMGRLQCIVRRSVVVGLTEFR